MKQPILCFIVVDWGERDCGRGHSGSEIGACQSGGKRRGDNLECGQIFYSQSQCQGVYIQPQ